MATLDVSIDVDKPIDEAWKVFMDESKMPEWLTGFQSMELIEGEPQTVGSKHRMVFEERGKEMIFIETVNAIEPPNEFSFTLDHESMASDMKMTLESIGEDKTRISSHTDMQAKTLMWKIMMLFMKGSMRKRQNQQFDKLKGLIESS